MITYLHGDATTAAGGQPGKHKIIAHICNDLGLWGKGFVLALSNRYPTAKQAYLSLSEYKLGYVQWVPVADKVLVANMIAQKGINRRGQNQRRVDYLWLALCLITIKCYIEAQEDLMGNQDKPMEVHMPRIGCGLGGGNWNTIEGLINDKLADIPVYVYDYP